LLSCLPQREDFSMACGVAIAFSPIFGCANTVPLGANRHSTHRNFS
jgi:hypothetical protein